MSAFVWPIYSAFRLLLAEKDDGTLHFRVDPVALFDDMKSTLVAGVQSFHQNQAHGVVAQLGKDKEVWLRLQAQIETELAGRQRLGTLKDDGRKPESNPAADPADAVHSGTSEVLDVLADPRYRARNTAVDRFMYLLRWAHERNPEAFKRVVSAIGGREKYFTDRAEELRDPKQILGSSIWVETNNDTPRKQKILGEALGLLGYDAATVTEAKHSLAGSPGYPRSCKAREFDPSLLV